MPFDAPAIADVVEVIIKSALAPLVARVKALEGSGVDVDAIVSHIATVRERVAILEARPIEPGPAGPAGADGVSFTDYTIEYDGERTFTHKWLTGGELHTKSFTTPIALYRGVYVDGRIYERGDLVTVNGSIYHCDADTTARPGDGAKEWTLAVKRGKDDRKGAPWPR
jgi:hypothetical protein